MSSQPSIINNKMRDAYISLGSNQASKSGTALETLRLAMIELESLSETPASLSSFYLTEPVDCAPGTAEFINAAARISVPEGTAPLDLLRSLHSIESKFGRDRQGGSVGLNQPRPLDLDLICISGEAVDTAQLILPHPRAHERAFVLVPLAEISPQLTLRVGQKNVSQLITELPTSPWVRRIS